MPTMNSKQIFFFYGENAFLSNFTPVPGGITYEGMRYGHVEGAFQAQKTLDKKKREEIARAKIATQARQLGRAVKLRTDWEEIKMGVMLELLRLKFADTPETIDLRYALAATEDRELIEGNRNCMTVWGSCRCVKHRRQEMRRFEECLEDGEIEGWKWDGEGENRLGGLLMTVRAEIEI